MMGLSVLSVISVVLCLLASGSPTAAKLNCYDQPIDKHIFLKVTSDVCSYFRPAKQDERGPAVDVTPGKIPITCILVNNSFPGPILRFTKGDWVRVDVQSDLIGRQISFHWHGLSQVGTPWSDGAVNVNSCPINPGMSATSIWQVKETGTFFYHGHAGLEEEYGLSGALIVDDPEDPYMNLFDEEIPGTVISVRDYWFDPDGHTGQGLAFRFYQKMIPFGFPLINGYFGNGTSVFPFYVLNVAADTCYRTRIINGNSEWPGWMMNITDENGSPVNFTLIALTSQNMQPITTYNLATYIAQRAEIILCTKPVPSGSSVDWRITFTSASPEDPTQCAGSLAAQVLAGCAHSAIIRVGGLNTTVPKTANRQLLASYPFVPMIDELITPEILQPYEPLKVPTKPVKTWNLYTAITAGNMYAWDIRNIGLMMPTAPPLFTNGGSCGTMAPPLPNATDAAVPYKAYLEKVVKNGDVVDIIINNLSPFMHPMHLHGHKFTVLGSRFRTTAGYSFQPQTVCPNGYKWAFPSYDGAVFNTTSGRWPAKDRLGNNFQAFAFGCPFNASDPEDQQYMLSNPYTTDILPVPAHGWAYARVKFDNPGFWFLHCHLNIHMVNGMGFFIQAALDKVPKIPSWVDTSCGGTCMPQNQVCGVYAPARGNYTKCFASTSDNECPPQ